MKLSTIFKKTKKKETAKVQKLEKDQLKQVVGGGDTKLTVSPGNVDSAINLRL